MFYLLKMIQLKIENDPQSLIRSWKKLQKMTTNFNHTKEINEKKLYKKSIRNITASDLWNRN